jgi:lipoprotein-releasing system ATP-binding protein
MRDHDTQQEVLRLQGLRKSYNVGKPTEVEVLHGLDLRLQRHDFAALVGASGSGKSTLLNLIGLLDRPTGGELFLLGEATRAMLDTRRTELRGSAIGFVFQFHHLIQAFTALENVLMPLMVAGGRPTREQREQVGDGGVRAVPQVQRGIRLRGAAGHARLAAVGAVRSDDYAGGWQHRQ